jgi:Sap, sulfolipid-1-addressing protein
MPTDLMIMSTVGINLESHDHRTPLIPFVLLTMLIAALPLIAYVIFRKRAQVAMPRVRKWMESNSWVVSIGAYAIFIVLLWP